MKMFPMLEIRMTGAVTNLPSEQDLQMYGVYTRTLSASGPVTAAYVPLQLITDPHGDGRVAFYARMLYRPDSTWGNAEQVRLIWVVQALTDNCEEYEDNQCSRYGDMNQLQIIQTYDDSWQLTGFNVREDYRGTELAIAYQDPDLYPNATDIGPLSLLAQGMDPTFLSNDLDENNQPQFRSRPCTETSTTPSTPASPSRPTAGASRRTSSWSRTTPTNISTWPCSPWP